MKDAEAIFLDTNILVYANAAVTKQLLQLLKDFAFGGKRIHDANIVATMKAYNIPCLLTHNIKDFRLFHEIIELKALTEVV